MMIVSLNTFVDIDLVSKWSQNKHFQGVFSLFALKRKRATSVGNVWDLVSRKFEEFPQNDKRFYGNVNMGFDGKKPERLKCRTSVEVSKKWRLVKNRREIVANVTY